MTGAAPVVLEACVLANFSLCGYEQLIPRMTNHEKDRHVLAAAVPGQVPIIVTFNLRHFEHLEPWGIRRFIRKRS